MYPVVKEETCDGCKNCIDVCPCEVYEMEDEKSKAVRLEDCIECGACVDQCPTESIQFEDD